MNLRISKQLVLCSAAVGIFCCGGILPAESATYYVRVDGGSAIQCTGLVDAAYPGSGTKQPCAFSHPFWAHAPRGNNPTKMVGGDTLIIDGSNNAEYMMGFKAPNTADTSKCGQSWPYECYMNPIPSGADPAHPTRILGKGWDTGCSSPPQLWATERAGVVINLQDSDNVEVQCIEVTDHSDCQEHGPNPCNRTSYPYGKWGKTGLQAWDSENILLKNVNIHGMALKGIHAGRLKDWTIEDSRIYANSFVGWDGDVGAFNSSNSGIITFTRFILQYSGCGETYPGEQPYNCYSQSQGGYGDGIGTHQTGANWIFNNVDISHNVSDGLDLLYHDGTGTITIKRSLFEGNAGNQVKVATNAVIENSIIIGNCNYFNEKSFTSTKSPGFNNCRAGGNALVFAYHPGMKAEFYNSTLFGSGDVVVISTQQSGCNGTERIISKNNIFLGGPQFEHPDTTDLYYAAGSDGNGGGLCGNVLLDDDYSVIWATKNIKTACNGKKHSLCENPKFNEPPVQWYYGDAYDVSLQSTSPAIGKGLVLTGKSSLDYNQNDRGNVWDIGALEYAIAPSVPVCADGIQYCLTEADCLAQAYYWYDGKCNAQPQRQSTCADGIQYCLTQVECLSNGYFWYTNACHAQAEPLPVCADGIQYCTNQTDCVINAHYWYNNACHANPQPQPGCADGIQYCNNNTDCATNGYYWYNNTCNLKPQPTCADGIQYCLKRSDCVNNGHHWYNNTCNLQPEPLPTCVDGIQYCVNKTDCESQKYFWYDHSCHRNQKEDSSSESSKELPAEDVHDDVVQQPAEPAAPVSEPIDDTSHRRQERSESDDKKIQNEDNSVQTEKAVEPVNTANTGTSNGGGAVSNTGGQTGGSGSERSGGFAGGGGSSGASNGDFGRGGGAPSATPVATSGRRNAGAPRSQAAPSTTGTTSIISPTPIFSDSESSSPVNTSATFADFAERTVVPETPAVATQSDLNTELDGKTYAELRKQLLKPEDESPADLEADEKIEAKANEKAKSSEVAAEKISKSIEGTGAPVESVGNTEGKTGIMESFQKGVQQMLQNIKAWFSGLGRT